MTHAGPIVRAGLGRPMALVWALGLVSICSADQAREAAQQEQQKQVQAETERAVLRMSTMLRALLYNQLDQAAETRLLAEAAQTLAGLSREQMAEVLTRLEAAARAPDEGRARQEVETAYARHREVVAALKGMLARYSAIKGLDQAAERLEKAAEEQLDLALKTTEAAHRFQLAWDSAGNTFQDRQRRGITLNQVRRHADDQRDLRQDIAAVLEQAVALRETLLNRQTERLDRLLAAVQQRRTLEELVRASELLESKRNPLEKHEEGLQRQRQAAADLLDLARQFREPQDRLTALREARRKLDQAIQAQETLRQEARTASDKGGGNPVAEEPSRRTQANQQARLTHQARDLGNLIQPHAPEVAGKIAPTAKLLTRAEKALRQGRPGDATPPQAEAIELLREVRGDLDRLIVEAEKAKADPLAAAKSAIEAIEQLLKEEIELRAKTHEATDTANRQRLPNLAGKQSDLARRTDVVGQQPILALTPARAALDRAARAMDQATKSLDTKKGHDAVKQQDQAIAALKEALKHLEEKIAKIQKRREEIAKLEDAAQRLGELAKQEAKVADQARDLARQNAGDAQALAQQQGALTPPTKEVGKQIEQSAPEAAKHVDQAAKNMEGAKGQLAQQQPAQAAKQADMATRELLDAQKELAKALDNLKAQELADQSALQPNQVNPASAADQVAKALEQARQAAQQAKQAAQAQQANMDPTQAMMQSQMATQTALAALAQAQAQVPRGVQPQLQQAEQQLQQAGQQLAQGNPTQAGEAQMQAAAQLAQALQALNAAAMAQQGQGEGQGQSQAQAQGQGQGQGNGQSQGQGQGQAQGQSGQGREKNQGRGQGDRTADGQVNNSASQGNGAEGSGSFLHLPARQRELIRQALSDKLPPEYAPLIRQYFANIATGKPAMAEKK